MNEWREAAGVSLMLVSNLIAAFSQILLKRSAQCSDRSGIREYLNPQVLVAYCLFLLTTVLGIVALRWIPLSLAAALGASGQIFVPLLSRWLLKEKISPQKAIGMATICFGIIIFSIG